MRAVLIGVGLALFAGVGYWILSTPEKAPAPERAINGSTAIVEVVLPQSLTPNAKIGQTIYDTKCAACHAPNGAGQVDVAPPLVHKIYEPSHHGDEAFQRAVASGVQGHHWNFGNMAPVDGLTRADVSMIVTYIRELQRANGID